MTTLPYTLDEQWKERDKMGGLRFSWWVRGIKEGLIACGCGSCNVLLGIVAKREQELTSPKVTTKHYRITRTFMVTAESNEDIEEVWKKVKPEQEEDYQTDEHIELISEI